MADTRGGGGGGGATATANFVRGSGAGAGPAGAAAPAPTPATTQAAATASRIPDVPTPASVAAFDQAFTRAFTKFDNDRGGYNLANLSDLRAAMPQYSREQFNAHLRELRKQGKYSLSETQSKRAVSQDLLAGGIMEMGNNLVHVSRRES